MGDFNAIANEDEKVGRNPGLDKNSRDWGLVDLGFKVPVFTWTNKRSTSEVIFERLNQVVAIVSRLQNHTEAYVMHLPRRKSDYAAILLKLNGHQPKQNKFKMESWWFGVEGFKEVWEECWKGCMALFWQKKIGLMGARIRKWAKEYRSPQNRLKEAESTLYKN